MYSFEEAQILRSTSYSTNCSFLSHPSQKNKLILFTRTTYVTVPVGQLSVALVEAVQG